MNLKRLVIYVGIVLLLASCYQYKKPDKPKDLISKDKMVDILIDVKLIASANGVNKTIMENKGLNPETYVFDKHNIDSLQFALSNDYYAFYSKEYEEIFTKVIDSLTQLGVIYKALEIKEEKEAAEAKKIQDSINHIISKDSLDLIKTKDSLKQKYKQEGGLIAPVSDKGSQPQ
jgi:hypothetical protein